MDIAIFNSCGGGEIPSFISLDGTKHWRVSLAEELMKLKETDNIKEDFTKLENNQLDFIRYNRLFYIKDKKYNYIFTLEVINVDISNKWRIVELNGKENIEYIKEPILIDKDLNLYK